jgi:NADH-quinone oxidoreductase subunit F
MQQEVQKHNLQDEVLVTFSGCHGLCSIGPIMVIYPEDILYCHVKRDDVPEIVEKTLKKGTVIERLLFNDPASGELIPEYHSIPFYRNQQRIILRNCGVINPECIEEYIGRGGYQGLTKALFEMDPESVIEEIKRSGLRGRGGGGFPTGLKWQFARNAPGNPKYVICNADEGDPGAFMDRSILEGDPHSVLEGMIIAGYAIGAQKGFIYCRAEYPLAIKRLNIAIEQGKRMGCLGKNILGSDFSFDIEVKEGAGAFVCGEETALIASIEGKRGEPRPRPPFPAERGLWGKPTNINNVKSYAAVAQIIQKGAEWFSSIGTKDSPGTAVFALTGKVKNTGLLEIPMGTTLGEIVFDIGGGINKDRKFKAVQTGGPLGGCLSSEFLNLPVDFDSLVSAGALMGSGGMIVVDETTCMVELARFFLQFSVAESCGQCTPCRVGGKKLLEILERITRGEGKMEDLVMIEDISRTMKEGSLCALGQGTPNPVLATLRFFRDEYEAHIVDKRCPAGVCSKLSASPCQSACPAEVKVPIYISKIAEGKYDEAARIHRQSNPFVSVCGRVCPAFCEDKCRRGELDEPVAIRDLKRFMADHSTGRWVPEQLEEDKKEKVAIVGGGPGGLTAALRLAQLGYKSTIFEALPVLGGMMRIGIPSYRLPREVLDKEIESILSTGKVEVKTKVAFGKDVSIKDLMKDHQAVLLSIGAQGCYKPNIPGKDLLGVTTGMELLKAMNLGEDMSFVKGKKVVVIGGGNVAMDASRSLLRLGAEEVHLVYRRERKDMPALEEEIMAAEEEGVSISMGTRRWRGRRSVLEEEKVKFHCLTMPVEFVGSGGKIVGVKCVRLALTDKDGRARFDSSARKRPFPIEGSHFLLEADMVVCAIGQKVEWELLSKEGIATNKDGTIKVDPRTYMTSLEGVFAVGDAVSGPASVVQAVGQANKAARAIHRFLRGLPLHEVPTPPERPEPMKYEMSEEDGNRPRMRASIVSPEARVQDFREVELGFPNEQVAILEARRCLRCDLEEAE